MTNQAGVQILGPEQRREAWQRLGSEQFDVVVIGGGVVGAGAALDAATRGLRVALVEARDFASGTSSRSSKMFHGGLRYLEQLEFGLVREALRERELSLTTLALTFLKIGAVLYGSGYVLLAFLRRDFVDRLGWLSDRQLLDAVAIGQFTPGPVFTTATFIGYVLAGWTGGLLATLAIFLPSFVFVALSHPFAPKIRSSPAAGAFLDGVNVAALGLMITVTWELARTAIVDVPTALLAAGAAVALLVFRVNSAWLVAGGAAVGVAAMLLTRT